jgi:hypothetical protein
MKLLVRFTLLASVLSSGANAEPKAENQRAVAEALFVEGRRLMAAGDAAGACPKFAESQTLDPGIGTLLNLGRCYARIGRTASAWAAYREAAGLARATGQSVRETAARAEADRLEPSLSKLRVEVPAADSMSLPELSLDGDTWSAALVGVDAPVDPGMHTLTARAPGFLPWSKRFESLPGRTVELSVPPLRQAPSVRARAPEPWRWTHSAALTEAVLGVASVGVGVVWGLDARSTYARSDSFCNARQECEPAGLVLREDAIESARLSTVAFVSGGVLLTGAAIVWFTRRSPDVMPWQRTGAPSRPPMLGVRF